MPFIHSPHISGHTVTSSGAGPGTPRQTRQPVHHNPLAITRTLGPGELSASSAPCEEIGGLWEIPQ